MPINCAHSVIVQVCLGFIADGKLELQILEDIQGVFQIIATKLNEISLRQVSNPISACFLCTKDIFENYTREYFEKAFSTYFSISCINEVVGSERIVYLMTKNKEINPN